MIRARINRSAARAEPVRTRHRAGSFSRYLKAVSLLVLAWIIPVRHGAAENCPPMDHGPALQGARIASLPGAHTGTDHPPTDLIDLDGRIFRLAALNIPPAMSAKASERIQAFLTGGGALYRFSAGPDGEIMDRYVRHLVHVLAVRDAGGKRTETVWLQASLVTDGLARVATEPDAARCAPALLSLEATARANRMGLWAEDRFRVRSAKDKDLWEAHGRFQIIEGRIESTGRKGAFLNFGRNWKTDMTVRTSKTVVRAIADQGLDLGDLEGWTVRVRGRLEWWDGPLITLTHRAQIELVSTPSGSPSITPDKDGSPSNH